MLFRDRFTLHRAHQDGDRFEYSRLTHGCRVEESNTLIESRKVGACRNARANVRVMSHDLLVIGGGAAGVFSAITCAEHSNKSVVIVEKTSQLLQKVKISGGGRCNVTHACFEPRPLSGHYPRGEKSLIGPFTRFGAAETVEWFESRGVQLKTEADGRMFPNTDSSQTIVDALLDAARTAGVAIRTEQGVNKISSNGDAFEVDVNTGKSTSARNVLIATGGTRSAAGARLAASLGHHLLPATPSLFTFKIDDARIDGLAGLAVPDAEVRIHESKLASQGPVLVTHWGMSGPGILKISAWGARELAERNYTFDISVNWLPGIDAVALISDLRTSRAKQQLATRSPVDTLPKRLWLRMLAHAEVHESTTWSQLGKANARTLATELTNATFTVDGKSTNKAEFVTCGGVSRDEINFKTMESKLVEGLYFAGEVIDVDGITGGFNFQNAWTNGYHAGMAIAASTR